MLFQLSNYAVLRCFLKISNLCRFMQFFYLKNKFFTKLCHIMLFLEQFYKRKLGACAGSLRNNVPTLYTKIYKPPPPSQAIKGLAAKISNYAVFERKNSCFYSVFQVIRSMPLLFQIIGCFSL